MGLQDEVPLKQRAFSEPAPGVSGSGAKPAGGSASAAKSAPGVSGSGAKPAPAAKAAPGGAKPASTATSKPSAAEEAPSGSQPPPTADPTTPTKKKKRNPSSPATPAKGRGPRRVNGCRGVQFGQPQEVDTKLMGAKRRNLGSLVQKDLEPAADGARGSKDGACELHVEPLALGDAASDEEDIVFKACRKNQRWLFFDNGFQCFELSCDIFDWVVSGDAQRNHQEVPQKKLLEEREKPESAVHSSCQDVLGRHWHHMASVPACAQQARRTFCREQIPLLGLGLAGGQKVNKSTTLCREFVWKKNSPKMWF